MLPGVALHDRFLFSAPIHRRALLRGLALGIAAGAMPACRTGDGTGATEADFLFENVALVPMSAEAVLPEHAVAVQGGRIISVVPQARASALRARLHIEGRGLHLMPALSDMHVHVEGEPERDFPLYLANGVTTVRNMSDRQFDHLRIRRSVDSEMLQGPRYLVSGPSLSIRNLRTIADVAPMLDRHLALRYDTVKIHGNLAPDVYDALINGARARGLKVSGHVQQEQPLAQSLRMDSIEHAEEFLNVPGRKVLEDPQAAAVVARQIAASGTYVTPTLVVFDAITAYLNDDRFKALKARPELRYLPRALREEWLDPGRNPYRARIRNPETIRRLGDAVPLLQRFIGELQKAGVPLLLGTDAAGALVPGFSLHDELALLVRSGLTPFQALRTGTVNPARFLGDEAIAGTIEAGKRAELILVAGNPLADIRNTTRVRGVLSRGRWHDSAGLAAMLDEVARRESPEKSPYLL